MTFLPTFVFFHLSISSPSHQKNKKTNKQQQQQQQNKQTNKQEQKKTNTEQNKNVIWSYG